MTRSAGTPARYGRLRARVLVLGLMASCTRAIELGSDQLAEATGGAAGATTGGAAGATTGGAAGATGGTAGTGDSGGAPSTSCELAYCRGNTPYACGNCIDDDGDGTVDAEDPECTGPCDDREDSFSVGLPGENAGGCREDCYFDRGNGPGNDGCRFSHECDPLSVGPDYPPSGDASCEYDQNANVPGGGSCDELGEEQADSCAEVCGPLTPNGCDCFGCCELPAGSGAYLWLGSDGSEVCDRSTLDDPTACRPCTPVDACLNRCDPCEACVGRPLPLPSCDDTTGAACPPGYDPCGAAVAGACSAGSYCVTGCCIPEPR